GQEIRVDNQFYSDASYGIEQIAFADGTVWDRAAILSHLTTSTDGVDVVTGTTGADYLRGLGGNDSLDGLAGDDELRGDSGDDDLTGGAGNDALIGGTGTDVAHFAGAQADYQLSTANGVVSITDTAPTVDGDDGTDTLSGIETLAFGDGSTMSIVSPIVLDLDGNGPSFTSIAASTASIDLSGDGVADKASWIGSGDAFLFLDRNHDGTMSGVAEMSFIGDRPDAGSDLEGLTAFDTNGDGALSAGDASFQDFGLWQDANGNGQVDTGETHSLADAGIASVSLSRAPTQAQWAWGSSIVLNSGTFTRSDGSAGTLADVALAFEAGSPGARLASGPVSTGRSSDQRAQVYARQLIDAIASFEPETPGFLDLSNAGATGNTPVVGLVGRPIWSELRSS
ncbi:MAG: calcium-binding protein, partial [Sphingomonas bacterium]